MNKIYKNLDKLEARIPRRWFQTLGLIGAAAVGVKLLSLLCGLRRVFWFQKDLIKRYGENSWAVITGGANGIGRQFALELARRGFNILVIDMDKIKINTLAQEISEISSALGFKSIIADFQEAGNDHLWALIEKELEDHQNISILVNNVGLATLGSFDKIEYSKIKSLAIVNMLPQVFMSHIVIKKMLERPKHLRSAIINMSGMLAINPTGLFSLYGATKGFNHHFSKALSDEYKDRIDCVSIKPGFVSTPLMLGQKGWNVITPETSVNVALKQLGHTNDTYGHWLHSLEAHLMAYSWYPSYWMSSVKAWRQKVANEGKQT
jgi:17beta-estradiol 17-dehydrogenase / very-long-chain 3-oxoacyl-CoA reductase